MKHANCHPFSTVVSSMFIILSSIYLLVGNKRVHFIPGEYRAPFGLVSHNPKAKDNLFSTK